MDRGALPQRLETWTYTDEHVKIFREKDFAYHKVKVVFWQTDEHDQPAIVTEPYDKPSPPRTSPRNRSSHDSDLTFRVRVKAEKRREDCRASSSSRPTTPRRNSRRVLGDRPEILSVEWTHRHYVQDDEYIPHGEDIEAFLKREIAKPIIRWEDSPQLGYEILPNKYFYRYQSPTPAKDLLAEFWRLEKEAEKMLEGLGQWLRAGSLWDILATRIIELYLSVI